MLASWYKSGVVEVMKAVHAGGLIGWRGALALLVRVLKLRGLGEILDRHPADPPRHTYLT